MKTLALIAALVLVPAASAAYPTPFASQGLNPGLLSLDKTIKFVALQRGAETKLEALRVEDGSQVAVGAVHGSFGIPMLTYNGLTGGLFRGGSAFVIQSVTPGSPTRFEIVGAKDLAVRQAITLHGYYGFDALSPDGSRMYLIQHTSARDYEHYVVRAYDLSAHRLLPGRIADKAQKSWLMKGQAVARTTSAGGRWVFTLYQNPGGYPFVHALDTVRGVAHCVGIPWKGNQDSLQDFTLALHGGVLTLRQFDRTTYARIRTGTWRVSQP
jgi:hypothetical protein